MGPFFRGSGRYLSNQIEAIAINNEPIKVVKANPKFSSSALFNAPNNNQICMLTKRICNNMIPVRIVLVLLGWASF